MEESRLDILFEDLKQMDEKELMELVRGIRMQRHTRREMPAKARAVRDNAQNKLRALLGKLDQAAVQALLAKLEGR